MVWRSPRPRPEARPPRPSLPWLPEPGWPAGLGHRRRVCSRELRAERQTPRSRAESSKHGGLRACGPLHCLAITEGKYQEPGGEFML